MNTLLVTKRTEAAQLVSARSKVYSIVAWYSKTRCKTTSGDVWEVIPCTTGEADYYAIR